MTWIKYLKYSLFGDSSVSITVGPDVNGDMITVSVGPISAWSILVVVIAAVLFLGFMWFYLYPLFKQRSTSVSAPEGSNESRTERICNALNAFRTTDGHGVKAADPAIPADQTNDKQLSTIRAYFSKEDHRSLHVRHFVFGLNLSQSTLATPPPAYTTTPVAPRDGFCSCLQSPVSDSDSPTRPTTPGFIPLSPPQPALIARSSPSLKCTIPSGTFSVDKIYPFFGGPEGPAGGDLARRDLEAQRSQGHNRF